MVDMSFVSSPGSLSQRRGVLSIEHIDIVSRYSSTLLKCDLYQSTTLWNYCLTYCNNVSCSHNVEINMFQILESKTSLKDVHKDPL